METRYDLERVFREFPELDVVRVKGGYVEGPEGNRHMLSVHAFWHGVLRIFIGVGGTYEAAMEDVARRIVRQLNGASIDIAPPIEDDQAPF